MEINKIYNGDCYELIKEIPDKSIDLIYTDVPYLMVNNGQGKSELAQRLRKVKNDPKLLNDYDFISKLPNGAKTIIKYYYGIRERERAVCPPRISLTY